MSSRRLIKAVAAATAALGLAACGPTSSSSSSATTAAAAAPSASTAVSAPGASGAPTGFAPSSANPAPTDGASSASATDDGGPAMSCTQPVPAAGHKIVMPVRRPTQDTLDAKAVKFVCDPNDGHYEGTGTEKPYLFAPTVKAQLATGADQFKTVIVGDLWMHIGDCLSGGTTVQPPLSCSAYPAYEITLDSSGKINAIKEIWHS
ncbi:hypothetical protein [Kitasatospora sp. MAP5-34]|uniref:hypothetical protein n=1 Tax=Kitasatospora sp. MAP5-34 TaxID=3035102 RepID=UPI002474D392|nr:hypothetical protein [Kitasatospora sp. MAP5-34]MDH6576491.1 ABC-type transport system substrate-binding protein [Kitasatospora sp. MAP5-34]